MPPPPPPPPPGGPPPPPMGGPKQNAMMKSSGATPDRGALLSQIRGGARLKKAVTNDRSAPIVSNKPTPQAAAPAASSGGAKTNGGFGGGPPMGLGGLFAGGMPKLKSTGKRAELGVPESSPSPPKESPPRGNTSPPKMSSDSNNQSLAQAIANRAAKMNGQSAPVPKQPQIFKSATPAPPPLAVKSPSPERPWTADGNAFPKDVSPPQKPRQGPPLPSKPPVSSVSRPSSQSSTKPRPTNKPPPPPKSLNSKFGTIGHPKRPPTQSQQVARRQSFGAPDSALSLTKPQAAPPPPPPPRNMSVPNSMNTIHRNAPPVPTQMPGGKKLPGSAPMAKPPPPPNKTAMSRSTPHLAHMGGGSTMRSGFESRFHFHNINDLSVTYEPTMNKRYPSKNKRLTQRRAPAPPQVAAVS